MTGKFISAAVAAVTAAMSFAGCQSGPSMDWGNGEVRTVAHRGYWNCEEAGYAHNSIAALRCAQEAGFWGSEFDVNMTSDGVLLVYHDSYIDGKRIDATPYEEFRDCRLKNGEAIPTIDDYLAQAVKYPETVLVYELKSHATPEIEDRLVETTAAKLKEYGLYDPSKVIFISFSKHICDRIAEMMPQFVNQYLGDNISPDQLYADGINGIDYHFSVFSKNPDWFGQARSHGMSVNCWTVNAEEDMKKMMELGVDCITTDNPDVLGNIIKDAGR